MTAELVRLLQRAFSVNTNKNRMLKQKHVDELQVNSLLQIEIPFCIHVKSINIVEICQL